MNSGKEYQYLHVHGKARVIEGFQSVQATCLNKAALYLWQLATYHCANILHSYNWVAFQCRMASYMTKAFVKHSLHGQCKQWPINSGHYYSYITEGHYSQVIWWPKLSEYAIKRITQIKYKEPSEHVILKMSPKRRPNPKNTPHLTTICMVQAFLWDA